MKSQHAREEQSVAIATALAVFVLVLVISAVLVAVAGTATGRGAVDTAEAAAPWALGAAALTAAAYLVRHRR